MELALELWRDFKTTPLLWQIVLVSLVIIGVISGVLKIPFINIKINKNKKCIGVNCSAIAKHIKIWKIKTQETMYEQLSIAEVINSDITMKMISIYTELTDDRISIDIYSNSVTLLEYDIRGLQKKWFKENHFTDKTETEFSLYIDEKITHIINRVTISLNKDQELFKVPRSLILEANTKYLIPYARDSFRKMFYSVREVSRKRELEIKKIEDSL